MLAGLAHPQADAVTVYMARRYGALFVGYAVILWLGKGSPPSPARTAILAGGVALTAVIGVVSVIGAVTGVVGPAVWGAAVIEAVLACGFVYFCVAARSCRPEGRAAQPWLAAVDRQAGRPLATAGAINP